MPGEHYVGICTPVAIQIGLTAPIEVSVRGMNLSIIYRLQDGIY